MNCVNSLSAIALHCAQKSIFRLDLIDRKVQFHFACFSFSRSTLHSNPRSVDYFKRDIVANRRKQFGLLKLLFRFSAHPYNDIADDLRFKFCCLEILSWSLSCVRFMMKFTFTWSWLINLSSQSLIKNLSERLLKAINKNRPHQGVLLNLLTWNKNQISFDQTQLKVFHSAPTSDAD